MFANIEGNKTLKYMVIFLITSFIIFLVGLGIAIYFIFISPINKGKTYGKILYLESNRTAVSYKVNGRTYEKWYNAYNSTYYVGKKIKIYYNKYKPYNSSIASMRYLSLVAPGIGIIMLGVSGIICFSYYRKYVNM